MDLPPSDEPAPGEHPAGSQRTMGRGAHAAPGGTAAAEHVSAYVTFLFFTLFVGIVLIWIGVARPLTIFAHDTFFLLDNAYRVLQGQVPHRDFSSAWGPLMFVVDAIGLALAGMKPAGLGYANALFGALLAGWAFFIARPRWSATPACAAAMFTMLLIAAPFPIGFYPISYSYAMLYNRYGYAILGIILLECAAIFSIRSVSERTEIAGALSSGIALSLLFFLKVSFGLVAGIVIAASLLRPWPFRRLIGLLLGFAAGTVAFLAFLRFDVMDLFRDVAMAAISRRMSLDAWHGVGVLDTAQGVLILAVGIQLSISVRSARDGWVRRLAPVVFACMSISVGYLLLITNQQPDTFPLNGYVAVVFASVAAASAGPRPGWWSLTRISPVLLIVVCYIPFFLQNAVSLTLAAVEAYQPLRPTVAWQSAPGQAEGLAFRDVAGMQVETFGAGYVEVLKDGLALIGRHSSGHDGVLTFDMVNPFNYLLARPSSRGGIAAAAYNYVFSDAAHPTPERFVGDAKLILVRKYSPASEDAIGFNLDTVDALRRWYGPYVRQHFVPVEESPHWQLWRRK